MGLFSDFSRYKSNKLKFYYLKNVNSLSTDNQNSQENSKFNDFYPHIFSALAATESNLIDRLSFFMRELTIKTLDSIGLTKSMLKFSCCNELINMVVIITKDVILPLTALVSLYLVSYFFYTKVIRPMATYLFNKRAPKNYFDPDQENPKSEEELIDQFNHEVDDQILLAVSMLDNVISDQNNSNNKIHYYDILRHIKYAVRCLTDELICKPKFKEMMQSRSNLEIKYFRINELIETADTILDKLSSVWDMSKNQEIQDEMNFIQEKIAEIKVALHILAPNKFQTNLEV